MLLTPRLRPGARQAGFSLIEFMIAITLSLIIVAALSAMFVSSMRSRDELERSAQQIENGRYASQILAEELQLAGYYDALDVTAAINGMPALAVKPDPCATTIADLQTSFFMHVQGEDFEAASDAASALGCVTDARDDSDTITLRRASGCVRGSPNCAAVTGAPYFQASLCASDSQLLSDDPVNWFRLDSNIAALDRTRRNCVASNLARIRRFMTHTYYIANNDRSGDGVPTLKRATLRDGGAFITESIANGIDRMQLEYGIDADSDGAPDSYTADPDLFNTCAPADCVQNWLNVVTVKIHVLARSTTTSKDHVDRKTYQLGIKADGTDNDYGPYNDAYKRKLFQAVVRLNNPAGRRER